MFSTKVEIDENIKTTVSGVYRIDFSTGHFYYGSSSNLYRRAMYHCGYIKSDFKYQTGPKCLKSLKGFDGTVKISIVEYVDIPAARAGCSINQKRLFERETYYILLSKGNAMMLNGTTLPKAGMEY